MNVADVAPPFTTGRSDTKMASPAQAVSPGPNRRKRMVPVGLKPPVRVAVSLTDPPTGAVGVATVAIVGAACVTTTASAGSLHGVDITTVPATK